MLVDDKKIEVRTLMPYDSERIQNIVLDIPHFSSPSEYIIWMLSETQIPFCKVAILGGSELVGYVFSLRMSDRKSLFIWQVGVALGYRKKRISVFDALCRSLSEDILESKIKKIKYSSIDESKKIIEKMIMKYLNTRPTKICEIEYMSNGKKAKETIFEAIIS